MTIDVNKITVYASKKEAAAADATDAFATQDELAGEGGLPRGKHATRVSPRGPILVSRRKHRGNGIVHLALEFL